MYEIPPFERSNWSVRPFRIYYWDRIGFVVAVPLPALVFVYHPGDLDLDLGQRPSLPVPMQFEIYFVQGPTLRRSAENENQKSPRDNRFFSVHSAWFFSSFSNPEQVWIKRERTGKGFIFRVKVLRAFTFAERREGVRTVFGLQILGKPLRKLQWQGESSNKKTSLSILMLCIYSYS